MHGLPVVTTPVGSEGLKEMQGSKDAPSRWGGLCTSDTPEKIAADAIELYQNPSLWYESQAEGFRLMANLFSARDNGKALLSRLEQGVAEKEANRARDFLGGMLWHHTARSTEYFSRWIELKNKPA